MLAFTNLFNFLKTMSKNMESLSFLYKGLSNFCIRTSIYTFYVMSSFCICVSGWNQIFVFSPIGPSFLGYTSRSLKYFSTFPYKIFFISSGLMCYGR